MAYYTYNDTKVTVNENLFFVNQISINSITNLSSKYISQERSSFDRVAQEGIRGSLSFSYFLTGSDPLKEYTIDEKKAISVNFAGLYFNSGYLTSFSFSARPHSPILIEAGIDFFTPLVGTFSPQREKLPDNKILTFEGISIDNSGIQKDTIRDVKYSFRSEIVPSYLVGGIEPSEIRFLKKQFDAEVATYDISGKLDYRGKPVSLALGFNNDTGLAESYKIEGRVSKENLQVSAGDKVVSSQSFTQDFVDEKPTLIALSTSGNAMVINGTGHEWFHLEGKNIETTTNIEIGDRDIREFEILYGHGLAHDKLSGVIANDTRAGSWPVNLTAFGGKTTSSSDMITVGEAGL